MPDNAPMSDKFKDSAVPDNVFNPRKGKTLQQELLEYTKALEEEWVPDDENSTDTSELAERTRKMLLNGTPHAIATLVELAAHSPVDGVRASCAKFIVENALNKKGSTDKPESTLDKLLREFNEQANKSDNADADS